MSELSSNPPTPSRPGKALENCCVASLFLFCGFGGCISRMGDWQEPLATAWAYRPDNVVEGTCSNLRATTDRRCPVILEHDYSKGSMPDKILQAVECRPAVLAEVLMEFAPLRMLSSNAPMHTQPTQRRKVTRLFGGRWRSCSALPGLKLDPTGSHLVEAPKPGTAGACPFKEYKELLREAQAWTQQQQALFHADEATCYKFRDQPGEVMVLDHLDRDSYDGAPVPAVKSHDAHMHPEMFANLTAIEAAYVSPLKQLSVGAFILLLHLAIMACLCFTCFPLTRGREAFQWSEQPYRSKRD